MKKCPLCSREYDNFQSFCLDDGNPLLEETVVNSQETVVLPRRKSNLPFIFAGLLVLIGMTVGGWFLLTSGGSNSNQDNRQAEITVQTPTVTPMFTPSATPTPFPSPSPSPTVPLETNTSIPPDSEIVSNANLANENNPPKQLPPIMKIEDHSVVFGLQQCRKSGSAITCDFLLTNKGADRRFRFVVYRSNLYDELGNGYNGKKGQLANQEGSNPQIDFVSGVTAKAQITFEGIDPNASKITLMRIQYDVGDDRGLEVKFRNVPLLISK